MKKLIILFIISSFVAVLCAFTGNGKQLAPTRTNNSDTTIEEERNKYLSEVLEKVKDKKTASADSVFLNLRTFNGKQRLKVSHLLAVMNYWSEALGVSCTHCHNTAKWESDEIPQKQIARDMYLLRQIINDQVQFSVKNFHNPVVEVNCGTCHRGNPKPASD